MATTWEKTGTRSGRSTQSATESAPPLGNVGVDMDGVGSVSVVLHAPTGQTFDGSGTLRAYRFLGTAWVPAPRADLDMADFAGLSDAALPPLPVDAPVGRFLYLPNGVGLSGGTVITAEYVCTLRPGEQSPG
jgi:hypothetical protein